MKKWNYQMTYTDGGVESQTAHLTVMGEAGWELCGVSGGVEMVFFYWKKEKSE